MCASLTFLGRQLDVRENVKFSGGHFAQWLHQHFPQSACVLLIEVKKFFMNEWTHQPDPIQLEAIHQALRSTAPGVLAALQQMRSRAVSLHQVQSNGLEKDGAYISLGLARLQTNG